MRKPSFLFQFLLGLTVVVFVTQTVLLLFFSQRIRENLQEESKMSMQTTAQLLKEWAKEDLLALFQGTHREILGRISNRGGYQVSLLDANGKLLQDTHLSPGTFQDVEKPTELDQARIHREATAQRYSRVMDREMYYLAQAFYDEGRVVGFIRIGTPIDPLDKTISSLFVSFLVASLFFLGLIFALAFSYSRSFSRSINKLILNAGAFAQGTNYEKIYVQKPRELRLLSLAMNKMYDQLDERFETILRQKNELQAILSGMVEAVVVLDQKLNVINVNPAARKLFPTERPYVGMSLLELCRNTELDTFTRALFESERSTNRTELVLQDLHTTLQVQGALLAHSESNVWGAILVMSDITQLKRLEMMRRDFVANVSHELKTPITNIKGYVETLQLGAAADPIKSKQFLDIVERHANRLDLIVNDLLILTRIENSPPSDGERVSTDLSEIVHAAAQVCQKKVQAKAILLNLEIPDHELRVQAYPLLLEQAVVNLLDNAIKFSPHGTVVTIRIRSQDSCAAIEVEDAGPGIPSNEHARIFERFYRTEKGRSTEGTGLGLSIVKHIMLVHKGNVNVVSPLENKPNGTRFVLTLGTYAEEIDAEVSNEADSDIRAAGL